MHTQRTALLNEIKDWPEEEKQRFGYLLGKLTDDQATIAVELGQHQGEKLKLFLLKAIEPQGVLTLLRILAPWFQLISILSKTVLPLDPFLTTSKRLFLSI